MFRTVSQSKLGAEAVPSLLDWHLRVQRRQRQIESNTGGRFRVPGEENRRLQCSKNQRRLIAFWAFATMATNSASAVGVCPAGRVDGRRLRLVTDPPRVSSASRRRWRSVWAQRGHARAARHQQRRRVRRWTTPCGGRKETDGSRA